jgi:hypothetical protein
MAIQFYNDKILFVNNKVAMAPACCCEPDYSDRCPCYAGDKLFEYVTVTIPSLTPYNDCDAYCSLMEGNWLLPWTACQAGSHGETYSDTFVDGSWTMNLYYTRNWDPLNGWMRERVYLNTTITGDFDCNAFMAWIDYHSMESCNAELPLTSLPIVSQDDDCEASGPVTIAFPSVYEP